jgi:hypothetical protein
MREDDETVVWYDANNLPPGRIDRTRMGKHNPDDTEPRPVITAEDREETRRLAKLEKWHLLMKTRA